MTSTHNILVSVVTVTLNAEKVIEDTIKSVIRQTYPNIEYVVVDGCSGDGTIKIVDLYSSKIHKIVEERDAGIYDAMNKSLSLISGDFVIFMNAGDRFLVDDAIESFVTHVCDSEAVYYCDSLFVDPIHNRSFVYGGIFNIYRLCFENICHQAIFYPRNLYTKYSYNLRYRVFADYDYNLNLYSLHYKFIYFPFVLSYYDLDGISTRMKDDFFQDKAKLILHRFGFYYYIYYILKKHIRIRRFLKLFLPI